MKLDKPEWTAVSFSNRLTVNFPEEPYGKRTVVQFIKILSKAEASLNNICLKTWVIFRNAGKFSSYTRFPSNTYFQQIMYLSTWNYSICLHCTRELLYHQIYCIHRPFYCTNKLSHIIYISNRDHYWMLLLMMICSNYNDKMHNNAAGSTSVVVLPLQKLWRYPTQKKITAFKEF